MKEGMIGIIVGVSALLAALTGCEGLVSSNVDIRDDRDSTHYYVDLVPAAGIPVVEDLNNGNGGSATSYALAEAFNKYDAVYYVGDKGVTVPPGKTLYVAPGSAVPYFHVAAEISRGGASRAGVSANAAAAKLVVLNGATMPLSGTSTLGGLLQVNAGGSIDQGSSGSASITGAGRVVVGGKVNVDSITVAGDVYVAQGDGYQYGIIAANIDTTYLALKTRIPTAEGSIDGSAAGPSAEDFYAFETVAAEASRDVQVDGAVWGNITSGGNVRVAENSHVAGLNAFYGYVDGSITSYGQAEVLGNVTGDVIAKDAVTVGSNLSPHPHRAQVGGALYSRTGNVTIKPRANSGNIVAYRGNVTIEEGAAAAGIDTYCDNSPYNNSPYDGIADLVNHGNVIVKGRVDSAISDAGRGIISVGSGSISSGGTVTVRPYGGNDAGWQDFGPNGYVSGDVAARYSATVDGVIGGNLDTNNYVFDGGNENQNVTVNGVVGGRVLAGGSLTVADHHSVAGNINPGVSFGAIYANGYVGGGAEAHSRNGTGPSVINGYVGGGSFYAGEAAALTIAATGRINTLGHGSSYSIYSDPGARIYGTLFIESGGELDADTIGDIRSERGSGGSLAGVHILAHANSLVNGGRLGNSDSGIVIERGAKIYTTAPIAIPGGGDLADQEAQFSALAASQVIHTNVAPPPIGSLGIHRGPLALTVGLHNSVTLTDDTAITGTVTVNGLLMLNGHNLTLNGNSVLTLGSNNSPMPNYDAYGPDYSNGAVSFANRGSLEFDSAAALNGLGGSKYEPSYDSSYNANNRNPVVIGVESSSNSGNMVEFALPFPATAADGPGENFMPGVNAVLGGLNYSSAPDYINKTSGFVWTHSAYIQLTINR
jgi:cytoskeletal protein CcmA (bactofilin family)